MHPSCPSALASWAKILKSNNGTKRLNYDCALIRFRREKDASGLLSSWNSMGTIQTNYLVFLLSPDFMLSLEILTPAKSSSLRIRTSPKAVIGVKTPPPPVFGYGSSRGFSAMASAASLVIPES